MVVLSVGYLQNFVKYSVELAWAFDIAPKTFCQYLDGLHARFINNDKATDFLIAPKHIVN